MDVLELALDFNTGIRKIELISAGGVACFRRSSDIFLFKSLLDTWCSLNSQVTEKSYKHQINRILPSKYNDDYSFQYLTPTKKQRNRSTREKSKRSQSTKNRTITTRFNHTENFKASQIFDSFQPPIKSYDNHHCYSPTK